MGAEGTGERGCGEEQVREKGMGGEGKVGTGL